MRVSHHLLFRSGRWMLAAVILAFTLLNVILQATDSGVATVAASYPWFLLSAMVLAVSIGDLDSDEHRLILSAAVGSPGRLHILRSLLALLWMVPPIILLGLLVTLTEPEQGLANGVVSVEITLSAVLLGVGTGSLLHRPHVRHRGVSLVLGTLAFTALMGFPWLWSFLNRVVEGRAGSGPLLLLLGVAYYLLTAIVVGGFVANRASN